MTLIKSTDIRLACRFNRRFLLLFFFLIGAAHLQPVFFVVCRCGLSFVRCPLVVGYPRRRRNLIRLFLVVFFQLRERLLFPFRSRIGPLAIAADTR